MEIVHVRKWCFCPYVLGLDLGSASLGWALIGIDAMETPVSLIRAGVRIFEPGVDGSALEIQQGKDQSKAVDRRAERLRRRQLRRRVARQRELFGVLQGVVFCQLVPAKWVLAQKRDIKS